jgi:hypothetical protein
VDARQLPCVSGNGAPTTETVGAIGELYMDIDTHSIYKCVAANNGAYTWEATMYDLSEIVDAVLTALPTWEGGSY